MVELCAKNGKNAKNDEVPQIVEPTERKHWRCWPDDNTSQREEEEVCLPRAGSVVTTA